MGKFNFNDLSTWGFIHKLITSIIILAIIFLLANNFFISDVNLEINTVNNQITKQEGEVRKAYKDVANLSGIEKETAVLKKTLAEALKFLPNEVSMPSLIDAVYQKARNNGIVFQSFTPESDIDNTYYVIKPIKLEAEVGFLSMASFIENVTALDRIMNVESVSFGQVNKRKKDEAVPYDVENRLLNMTAELRTYIFKDDDKLKQTKGRRR